MVVVFRLLVARLPRGIRASWMAGASRCLRLGVLVRSVLDRPQTASPSLLSGEGLVVGSGNTPGGAREIRSFSHEERVRRASLVILCTRGERAREGGRGGSPHQGQLVNQRPRRSDKVKAGALNQYGARSAGYAL